MVLHYFVFLLVTTSVKWNLSLRQTHTKINLQVHISNSIKIFDTLVYVKPTTNSNDTETSVTLAQWFLTFFSFIHSCHWLLHSHSPYALWMYRRSDNNDNTRSVHCWQRYLLYFIYSRDGRQCCKLGKIFKHGLITDQTSQNILFHFISTCTIWRKKKFFTSRFNSNGRIERISLYAQIFVLLLEKLHRLPLKNAVIVL